MRSADRRIVGLVLAFSTAIISGVAVFVNSYGLEAFGDPTGYTTAKNVVAAFALIALSTGTSALGRDVPSKPLGRGQWLGLAIIALIGGSVPFVLFFEGLSQATSPQAAFIHKTLVVWVALLAIPLLRERVGLLHIAAIALLLWGQATLAGDLSSISAGTGEVLVFAATLMWAVETVIAKRLLAGLAPGTVAIARMAGGAILLIVYALASGKVGDALPTSAAAWGWVLLTGFILAAYVATWYSALTRAQAVDVTAVLVLAAVITALMDAIVNGARLSESGPGLVLITIGATTIAAGTTLTTSRRAAA